MITLPIIHPSPSRTPSLHPRILFAIAQREKEIFLPDLSISEAFDNADCTWPEALPTKADPAAWRAMLEDIQPDVIVSAWKTPPIPADLLTNRGRGNLNGINDSSFPLQYICHLTGSVRQTIPRIFIEHGGLVTNWGGQVARQVAEHALLLALASLRQAPTWLGSGPRPTTGLYKATTRTLFNRRISIHGCGSVARSLATLLKPFACDISCFSAGVPDEMILAAGMKPVHSLTNLFSEPEIFFECEALTPTNKCCVNAALLARLPKGTLFVNVARGHLVDESALLDEVRSGRLQVALDVLTIEPVPIDSPWRTQSGAIYSPHIAGPTSDMMPLIGNTALQNLTNWLTGRPLTNLVTLEQYDRST